MSNISFLGDGWSDYLYWQNQDKKTLKRINELLKDIQRNGPMTVAGKPERLKYRPCYSRRIDDKNRLVYDMAEDTIYVISCKGHYE